MYRVYFFQIIIFIFCESSHKTRYKRHTVTVGYKHNIKVNETHGVYKMNTVSMIYFFEFMCTIRSMTRCE